MTGHLPPLLIIGSYPKDFDLQSLLLTDSIQKFISLNEDKYTDLDRYEIIADGMTFELELFSETETATTLKQNCTTTLFSSAANPNSQSIGVWLGENLQSGKHLPSVNRSLLGIAKLLGREASATHVCWLPAQHSLDFRHFEEAVEDYLAEGPTPILFQIAISKNEKGLLKTLGLSYFSGQEITLNQPISMSDSETIKRLVRVAHDIAVNGKIDNAIVTEGLDEGEKITFKPSHDLSNLSVEITVS